MYCDLWTLSVLYFVNDKVWHKLLYITGKHLAPAVTKGSSVEQLRGPDLAWSDLRQCRLVTQKLKVVLVVTEIFCQKTFKEFNLVCAFLS